MLPPSLCVFFCKSLISMLTKRLFVTPRHMPVIYAGETGPASLPPTPLPTYTHPALISANQTVERPSHSRTLSVATSGSSELEAQGSEECIFTRL